METIAAFGDPLSQGAIRAATEALSAGQVIAIPTDTVYGLAVDPFLPGASEKVFKVKRRPHNVDLAVFVSGKEQALSLATAVPSVAVALMENFWPGALTIVVPRAENFVADLGSDDMTVGLRCPDHPVPSGPTSRQSPRGTG